jgi:hypothetical protein
LFSYKALARAVYSRPQIALFDDIFSGLDNATSQRIFKNLFSPNTGLLRKWKATILLATQSGLFTAVLPCQPLYANVDFQVDFLASADHIIALGREGKITEQGSFERLFTTDGYVQSLMANKSIVSVTDAHQDEIISVSAAEASVPKVEYKAKQVEVKDDKRRQTGDSTVYKYYFGSIGTVFLVTLLVLEVVWAFLQSFPSKLNHDMTSFMSLDANS